ncbi:protein kinase [Streptomyces sp. NBC_00250]|uniref:protein kinase domain-containing protein n=1 Tax=Streptomyces sp. NBC_00250 TaxID=2903641 RepID=UPI002E27C960|nr:protein kinase [Streptomyces sp. NBC_00250]
MHIDTVVYYQVTDVRAATYEVASYIQAIEQLTITTLRNIIGGMDLERTLTSGEEINAAQQVLDVHGPLPAATLRAPALGVAEALEAIHACGIVHRDLKPGNILIAAEGPRVIDFGIARGADATALTRTDFVIGTRGFLAPEQMAGGPPTAAVDTYAFGMVLCHAGGAASAVGGTVLDGASRLLPADLAAVATACLSHDPAGRPSPTEILRRIGDTDGEDPSDWLPPALRTLVGLHQASTVTAAPPE